jgi:AcrR family transcriptional regulator
MQGLREEKRARTATAIVDATMALLRKRSFDEISVDDIAAAAGVARRTVFRYFPKKEDIVIDRRRIDRASALRALAQREPGEDEIALVVRVLDEQRRRMFSGIQTGDRVALHRLTHEDPVLAGTFWLFLQDVRDVVVAGLLRGRHDRAEALRIRTLVMACIVAVEAAATQWAADGMKGHLSTISAEAADHLRRGFATRRATGSRIRTESTGERRSRGSRRR